MELKSMLDEKSLWLRDKNRVQAYQYGNKTGKLLARSIKKTATPDLYSKNPKKQPGN